MAQIKYVVSNTYSDISHWMSKEMSKIKLNFNGKIAMQKVRNLWKSSRGIYYFRIAVPEHLRGHFGKREIKKSLKTSDLREAKARVAGFRYQYDMAVMAINRSVDLFHDQRLFETSPVIDDLIPSDAHGGVVRAVDGRSTITLLEAIRRFVRAHEDEWSKGTLQKYWFEDEDGKRSGELSFILWVFGNIRIGSITRDAVREFKDNLLKTPKMIMSGKYAGKSYREVLDSNHGERFYSIKTARSRLSLLSSLMKWCHAEGLVGGNPVEGIHYGKQTQKRLAAPKRQPFTDSELSAIFNGYIYTGVETKFKKKKWESFQFWLPLIGLFSGARMSEIVKLPIKKIKKIDDIHVFKIEDTKSVAGNRMIPIHSKLLELGILDYAKFMKNAGHDRLFPEIEPYVRKGGAEDWSRDASRWFNKHYRKECGIEC